MFCTSLLRQALSSLSKGYYVHLPPLLTVRVLEGLLQRKDMEKRAFEELIKVGVV